MIVRTGRRIPGVIPHGGVHAPISVVRMAVGDAYGAKEWREGEGMDEAAFRTERIERRICHGVAEFAFQLAERTGAKVFGGPKYTVSPVYEGMLKEEMDAAAERHPEVPYEPQLIDATFALLIATAGDPLVIPSLNRDGDILSDLVLPLFGSIAGAESLLVAFGDDDPEQLSAVMAEAAHGTAPALQGKNVANPLAMILAGAAVLGYAGEEGEQASRAIRESALEVGRGRLPHCGSRGPRGHDRVHRRGHPANEDEARGLVDALGGARLARSARRARPRATPRRTRRRARGRTAIPHSGAAPRARRMPPSADGTGGSRSSRRTSRRRSRIRASSGIRSARAAAGVARSVPALVMVEHRRQDLARRVERAEHAHAVRRMAAHLNELGLGQRPGLQQDRGRNRELPDVVEQRAEPQHREALLCRGRSSSPSPGQKTVTRDA